MNPTVALVLSKIGDMLLSLLGTAPVKRIIVDKLKVLSKKTDNSIDDSVVKLIESALYNTKDVDTLKKIYGQWTGKTLDEDASKATDAPTE